MSGSVDLRKIITKKHQNKWVAISTDFKRILGYSKDLSGLRSEVGSKKVIFMKVPESGRNYAF